MRSASHSNLGLAEKAPSLNFEFPALHVAISAYLFARKLLRTPFEALPSKVQVILGVPGCPLLISHGPCYFFTSVDDFGFSAFHVAISIHFGESSVWMWTWTRMGTGTGRITN